MIRAMETKNRSKRAREQAGLTPSQAARLLSLDTDDVIRIEESDAQYFDADRPRLAAVYGVDVAWLDGDREARDYATIDAMRGADTLSFHDRDILAEFAASMPRRAAAVGLPAKARHVKAQGQTRNHECHWPGCTAQVPPAMWGCKAHWYRLPKALRDKVWRTYRIGQERDMSPSAEYLAVVDEVQRWIKAQG